MKAIFTGILLLAISISVYAQPESKIDILNYSFNLQLSDASDTIIGKAAIKVRFLTNTDQLELDLTSLAKGKGMIVTAVTRDLNQLSFVHENDKLVISVNQKASDTTSLVIYYKGIPADGLIIAKNKYGHRTFFADNWPNRGHNWIPCNDVPGDKAPVEFIITAPQHYQVVANGVQVEETNLDNNLRLTHWKEDVPLATKIMVIGVADFAVNLAGTVNCVPVFSWVYPEDRVKGFYDYALTVDILSYFMKNVGPYGYKKLANVQSKTTYGGLENANTIFYHENSITGDRKNESLLAHEVAHQWFGDMVTEKKFAHVWLSEGFATYFTILYFENKYGKDTAAQMRKKDRQEVIAFSKTDNAPVVNDEVTNYMDLLSPNSYQKGGWVLHMLRHELGDSVFWKGIREYYSTYTGRNADTGDLQKIFEKVSGKKLETFFRQWLYTPGQPKLNITWKTDKNKKLFITVKQEQVVSFVFPLELKITGTSGKTRLEKLTINKKEETFILNSPETISSVVADPGVNLLCEEKVTRIN